MLECVNYYTSHDTNVNLVFLDATKAFDRVEYVKLFRLLLRRGISPVIINMYTNQKVSVVWNNVVTEPFTCSNGVKQGGVLSPILFGVYMDELLIRLKNSGVGCHIGNVFLGALAYADDLAILSPTIHATQKLLDICSHFGKEYDVQFNPSKSKWISYQSNDSHHLLNMDGNPIERVRQYVHLGTLVGSGLMDSPIQRSVNKFYSEVNLLMAQFSNIFSSLRYKLFQSYCMSFYGSQLWDFSGREIEKIFVAWRKAVRRVRKLPALLLIIALLKKNIILMTRYINLCYFC